MNAVGLALADHSLFHVAGDPKPREVTRRFPFTTQFAPVLAVNVGGNWLSLFEVIWRD